MNKKRRDRPSVRQLEAELDRVNYRSRCRSALRGTVCTLAVVAAASVLAATLWLPVLQICGSSMTPTLRSGDVLVAVKTSELEPGDIAAFYLDHKILVKRVICGPGDRIDMDGNGSVSVNGLALEEPYLAEKALGSCDIDLPCQVPAGSYFVMGDHRAASVDSRNTAVGCVPQERIIGKIIFRVWPLNRMGALD